MNLAFISFEQVIIMFIMISLGFTLVKLKLIDISAKKSLSNILVYLVVPFMIINSYVTEYNQTIMNNLLYTFLISFVVLILGIVFVFLISLFYHIDSKRILMFAMMFSNAAYMGFPLVEAMFGADGLIYASGFVSMFNILLWTIGYMVVSRSFSFKTAVVGILKTPVLYALIIGIIIFFFQIPIPNLILKPISLIGAMNTPLSMIITGMIIASSNIFKAIKNKYLWLSSVIRLIIIPFISLGVILLFNLVGVNKDVLKIVFILEACPCAAITSIFAIKFNYDENLAASLVVVTTLISAVTLPLFVLLVECIL